MYINFIKILFTYFRNIISQSDYLYNIYIYPFFPATIITRSTKLESSGT